MAKHADVEMGVQEYEISKQNSNKQKLLLVGEGDFSFSLSLAKAFGSATSITAASLDCRGNTKPKIILYVIHFVISYHLL